MNQRHFCHRELSDGFRHEFGRELGLRAYIFVWVLYGKAIMFAMGRGLFIKLFGIGSFRPRANMVLLVKKKGVREGLAQGGEKSYTKVDKKVEDSLVNSVEETYLCPNKSGGLKSRLNVRRYVSHSHSE